MQKTLLSLSLFAAMLGLAACVQSPDEARPDYRVGVLRDPETGQMVALAKLCPTWHRHIGQGLENHFDPQFSCYDYYNLAHEIEQPNDLVIGRRPALAEAEPGVLSIERYREDKTKQLINPKDIPSTTGGQ